MDLEQGTLGRIGPFAGSGQTLRNPLFKAPGASYLALLAIIGHYGRVNNGSFPVKTSQKSPVERQGPRVSGHYGHYGTLSKDIEMTATRAFRPRTPKGNRRPLPPCTHYPPPTTHPLPHYRVPTIRTPHLPYPAGPSNARPCMPVPRMPGRADIHVWQNP